MHPDLLNNSLFLKYYAQWQSDTSSVAFVPVVEYFLFYDMIDEAMKVCREGLKNHPQLVSGLVALAKVHFKRGNFEEAEESIIAALQISPDNAAALKLLSAVRDATKADSTATITANDIQVAVPRVDNFKPPADEIDVTRVKSWNTITMANIFMAQGHYDRARDIFLSILKANPDNKAALNGLGLIPRQVTPSQDEHPQ